MIGFRKDGGPQSKVDGWFLEAKSFATLALLRFHPGTREVFHAHAFNCVSLILGPGVLLETHLDGRVRTHGLGRVLITRRSDFHQVRSIGRTYVLTLRGPWARTWREIDERGALKTLRWGRKEVRTWT